MTANPLADVSRETRQRLETLIATLEKWQKAINLIGKTTLEDVWDRHVVDSAQLVPHIPAHTGDLTDLGSGAGFPALVIAAMRPEVQVTVIEADARKAAFIGDAARKMELPLQPKLVVKRIEVAPPASASVITARALAPLSLLLAWASRHRSDTAICLFHKGKGWQGEVNEAKKEWDFSPEPIVSVTDRDAVLLRIGPYKPTADLRDRQPEGRRR